MDFTRVHRTARFVLEDIMGLNISGEVSHKHYRCGYNGLHQVRWLAMLSMGAPINWKNGDPTYGWITHPWVGLDCNKAPQSDELMSWMFAAECCGYFYPNLIFHSDCDGEYTPKGKVFKKPGLRSGNSKELLKELRLLKNELKDCEFNLPERAMEIYQMLYDLVEDEVLNGKGVLKFY